MADAPQVAVLDGPILLEKPGLRIASSDEAAEDVYARANAPRPGFTRGDMRDMWRLGRVQELKVWLVELRCDVVHGADERG